MAFYVDCCGCVLRKHCNRPCCPLGGAVASVPVCLQLTEEDLEATKLDPKEVFTTCSYFFSLSAHCEHVALSPAASVSTGR